MISLRLCLKSKQQKLLGRLKLFQIKKKTTQSVTRTFFLSPYENVMKSYLKLENSLRNGVKRKVDVGTIELPPHSNDRRFELMNGYHLMRLLYKAGLVDLDFAALHDSLRNCVTWLHINIILKFHRTLQITLRTLQLL